MVNKYLLAAPCRIARLARKHFVNTCLPQCCVLCRQAALEGLAICSTCHLLLLKQSLNNFSQCLRCALPLGGGDRLKHAALHCPRCISAAPDFSRCIAALSYDRLSGLIINRFKHKELLAARSIICSLMIDAINQRQALNTGSKGVNKLNIDMVIPVPLHPKRLRQRGFNQALEIAKPIARHFKLPIAPNACQRNKYANAQQTLNSRQRAKNLDNAFSVCANQIAGRRIAIVDDVVTTTHTARSLSKLLMQAGAVDCEVWCFARTPVHH